MDYKKIQFEFIENGNIGLSKEQIEYIKELIAYYTKLYPKVILKTVCDFFLWDYAKDELDEYTYTHNRENEEYVKYDALAKYNDDDKLIGFNHIRLSKMDLDNNQVVNWVKRDLKGFEEIKKQLEIVQRKAKFIGQSAPSFSDILRQSMSDSELKQHGIEKGEMTEEYIDVLAIRLIEEYPIIRRIVAHEFGHAIAYSYHLEEDNVLSLLYEKYREGFENMQEFIAECFMASELTNKISLANKVRERINQVTALPDNI